MPVRVLIVMVAVWGKLDCEQTPSFPTCDGFHSHS